MEALNGMTLLETLQDENATDAEIDDFLFGQAASDSQPFANSPNNEAEESKQVVNPR